MKFKDYLLQINACSDAIGWVEEKTWKESYEKCDRADWLLWLFAKSNPNDIRLLTLAKGLCAKTVLHLMKDERSKKAVCAAIAFGRGEIEMQELNEARRAAYDADAYAAAADAYAAADATAADARLKSLKEMADIVRETLPFELWNIKTK